MADYDRYDFFIKFDADNLMEPDYISKMNDAFDAGAMSARGYSNSKNLTENVVSGISGLWYIRDCRYSCHVRAFLNTTQMLGGAGMMFSAEIIRKHGGWDCLVLFRRRRVRDEPTARRDQDQVRRRRHRLRGSAHHRRRHVQAQQAHGARTVQTVLYQGHTEFGKIFLQIRLVVSRHVL